MLIAVVLGALFLTAIGELADAVVDRARAQAAADAAALAGVTGGRATAAHVAAANGAVLARFERTGRRDAAVVTVIADVDGRRATARATNGP
jgi:Flp pilus assembly protein TadG